MNNGTIHTIEEVTAEDEGDDEEEVHVLNFKKGFTKRRFNKKNQKKDWGKKEAFPERKEVCQARSNSLLQVQAARAFH